MRNLCDAHERAHDNSSILMKKETVLIIKFLKIASNMFSLGFRLSKTVEGLGRYVKDCVWLLEKDTPIPAEFQVINGDNHVDILPDKRTPVTVEKFREVFITISLQ